MARRKPISVRLSGECEELLDGLGTNQSAAIRGLLLIGADACGLDLTPVEADLRTLLGADLPDVVHLRLRDLIEQSRSRTRDTPSANVHAALPTDAWSGRLNAERHSEGQLPNPPSGYEEDSDPLASVGFDFE